MVVTSIGLTLILLEIGVRLFAPVTDYPLMMFYADIGTHYRPNQSGVQRFGADGSIGGRYHINSQGWNSLHEYETQNPSTVLRIALIGDSFVDGLQIDVDKRADTVIENQLGIDPRCQGYDEILVYNFGMPGSPLSQYLNVLRYTSTNYPADVYIVNVVFNDIDQSWASIGRSDFMTFKLTDHNELEEVAPKSWVGGWTRPIAIQSALFRFLYFNLQIKETMRNTLSSQSKSQDDQDAIPKSISTSEAESTPHLIETILKGMQDITSQQNANLLVTLDGDRFLLYSDTQMENYTFKYGPTVMEKADALGVSYVDLNELFIADYQHMHQRFDFPTDYHWNERGHLIMGSAVVDWISQNICRASP